MKNTFVFYIICLFTILACVTLGCTSDKVEPADISDSGESCDTNLAYFVNDIQPIIRSNCAYSGCHGDGSAEDDVDLSTYALILATGEVKPGNAADSKLYKVMTETDPSDIMPPPPTAALSSEQIAQIGQWIDQGALNN